MSPESDNELAVSPEISDRVDIWLNTIFRESLLPPILPEKIRSDFCQAISDEVPVKFIMTLCPAFNNIEGTVTEGSPTREIAPFNSNLLPRLKLFGREMASFIVGTQQTLGVKSQILLIVNDIFEPGVAKRIANIDQAPQILAGVKGVLHTIFQEVDDANPEIWSQHFQKSIKIVLQSDLIKPLSRFGLPDHVQFVTTLMRECLDPNTSAFDHWLTFLHNTRADKLMSPNAWLTQGGALTLHERVRFLVAMYWTDGLINPLLFKTIFVPDPNKRTISNSISPIFISGVTRQLQAEMEMSGVNFHTSGSIVDNFSGVIQRSLLEPRPVIHVIRNTATWNESTLDPFTFGGRVVLK